MSVAAIEVQPLAPQRLADFLAFFDHDAFVDNRRWQSCYCQYLHTDHGRVDWALCTAQQNRAAACQRIEAARMPGLLAYRDGRVVGWCNAAPLTMLPAYADERTDEDAQIGQVGCFVVAPSARRQGVARALLSAALGTFRQQSLRIAQGFPQRDARSDAQQHLGPLSLLVDAGFHVHGERDDGTIVVRRNLV